MTNINNGGRSPMPGIVRRVLLLVLLFLEVLWNDSNVLF